MLKLKSAFLLGLCCLLLAACETPKESSRSGKGKKGEKKEEEKLSEGKVVYSPDLSGLEMDETSRKILSAAKLTIYFSGKMMREEVSYELGNMSAVIDGASDSVLLTMQALGANIAVEMDLYDYNEVRGFAQRGKATMPEDTMEIGGFLCGKVTIPSAHGRDSEVFFTDKIVNHSTLASFGIDGFPMQIDVAINRIPIVMIAKNVIKEKQPQDMFSMTPPDGYAILSLDEWLDLRERIGQ